MKFLWFNHRDITHPDAGGAELYIHEIGKRLVKLGHEVALYCERYGGSKKNEEIDGISIQRMGGKFSTHMFAFQVKGDWYDLVLDDLAHGVPFYTPFFIKNRPICALVMHWHGRSVFFKELRFPLTSVAMICEKTIPILYRNIPWITISESTKREMRRHGIRTNNVTVIPPGVDSAIYKPSRVKAEKPLILCVSRLKKYKNINHVILAMKGISKKIPDAKLVIVGTGDYENNLKGLVRRLRLENEVVFYNFIGLRGPLLERKIELLRRAWVFVAPSSFEGFSISTLEAMACGTPIIANSIESLNELIRHLYNGLLYPCNRVEILEKYICMLLKDDDLNRHMSKNARESALKFSWEKTAERFLELCTKIHTNYYGFA